MNPFIQIFTNPRNAFLELKDSKKWIFVLIVICFFNSMLAMISLPYAKDSIIKSFEKKEDFIRDKLGDEQYDKMLEEALIINKTKIIITGITGFLNFLIMTLLAAVLCYMLSIPAGLPGVYIDYLKIFSYASIVTMISIVLRMLIVPLIGNGMFDFSLAYFLPESMKESYLGNVLTVVNPFYIWFLYMVFLGCESLLGAEKKKSIIVVFLYLIFVVLIRMIFFYMSTLF